MQRLLATPVSLQTVKVLVVPFFVIPCTVAHQAPWSMGFYRQEYWWGISPLLQGIFPTSNPGLLHRRQMR